MLPIHLWNNGDDIIFQGGMACPFVETDPKRFFQVTLPNLGHFVA